MECLLVLPVAPNTRNCNRSAEFDVSFGANDANLVWSPTRSTHVLYKVLFYTYITDGGPVY